MFMVVWVATNVSEEHPASIISPDVYKTTLRHNLKTTMGKAAFYSILLLTDHNQVRKCVLLSSVASS